ncbi:unnamed protein product [Mycena citricolor]|uniref:BHLH domain-containing protein n=1 Tax=Mycena citricolor TaxID=2018698 RepID=A0AAD2GW63_9AGAR|nr:unnamed protein product [Mycena citricolor]
MSQLPFILPPSPTSSASSGSADPSTPGASSAVSYTARLTLPTLPDLDGYDGSSAGGVKRTLKFKKMPSAAERRASHNAVERQRREALNSRFLDLAGVLPNLVNIRRPSKSSIVNSSIAYVNASRRHRICATQQLRALANECDALRREANEWRSRAGVHRLETPARGEMYAVMGDELQYDASDLHNVLEYEDGDDYAAGVKEDELGQFQMPPVQEHQVQFAPHSAGVSPLTPQSAHSYHVTGWHTPAIASPAVYEHYDPQLHLQQLMNHREAEDKWAYSQQMMSPQSVCDTEQLLAQDRSRQAPTVW